MCKLGVLFRSYCSLTDFNNRNKAVSDGAVSFYLDHHVRSRVSKVCYGVATERSYIASDPEHRKRAQTRYRDAAGIMVIPNGFRTILAKVVCQII